MENTLKLTHCQIGANVPGKQAPEDVEMGQLAVRITIETTMTATELAALFRVKASGSATVEMYSPQMALDIPAGNSATIDAETAGRAIKNIDAILGRREVDEETGEVIDVPAARTIKPGQRRELHAVDGR